MPSGGLLTVTADGIARITVFGDPDLVARFGLPLICPVGQSI